MIQRVLFILQRTRSLSTGKLAVAQARHTGVQSTRYLSDGCLTLSLANVSMSSPLVEQPEMAEADESLFPPAMYDEREADRTEPEAGWNRERLGMRGSRYPTLPAGS